MPAEEPACDHCDKRPSGDAATEDNSVLNAFRLYDCFMSCVVFHPFSNYRAIIQTTYDVEFDLKCNGIFLGRGGFVFLLNAAP